MYLDTGTFQCEPRKQVPLFRCPPDYLEVYQCFEGYCRAKAYAGATMEINIRHVRKLLLYLESQEVGEPDQITASHLEAFLHTYEGASVKYIGTALYVLRNFGHFLFHQGFTSCDISCLLPKARIPRNGSVPYSWKKEDVKRLLETVDREVLGWNVSLTASTVQNCDNSQKHLLDVVKSIRTGYNTNKEFCDNSQKLSIERRIIIWKLRETSI